MINITTILYPTDFSSYSTQAYFHAIALAEKHRASLTILYVYVPGVGRADNTGSGPADKAYWQEMLEQIRPVDPAIPVSHILLEGDPATEIVRFAQDAGMDLIVMGTDGSGKAADGQRRGKGDARVALFGPGRQAAQGPDGPRQERRGVCGQPGLRATFRQVRSCGTPTGRRFAAVRSTGSSGPTAVR